MIVISQRLLIGLVAAGLMAAPLFTTTVSAQAKKKPAPKPAVKGDAKKGKEQFKSEGCTGCHKSKDYADAGEIGPDLSKIGINKEWPAAKIAAYIKKPKSGSLMPASQAPQATIDNMTAYLLTQK